MSDVKRSLLLTSGVIPLDCQPTTGELILCEISLSLDSTSSCMNGERWTGRISSLVLSWTNGRRPLSTSRHFDYFLCCCFLRFLTWYVLMTGSTCSQPVEKTAVHWCGKLTWSKWLFCSEECGQPVNCELLIDKKKIGNPCVFSGFKGCQL